MKSEYKKRYDSDTGRYIKKHIYSGEFQGEGYKMDMLKALGNKLFGKTTEEMAKKAVEKAATSAATKTGEHLGNKAGDKIVQTLSKKQQKEIGKEMSDIPSNHIDVAQMIEQPIKRKVKQAKTQPMSDLEILQRVNNLISGGRIKKRRSGP